jgi:hypothetical protein
MFDAVDSLHDSTRIATGVLSTIKINQDRMMKARGRLGPFGGLGGPRVHRPRGKPESEPSRAPRRAAN